MPCEDIFAMQSEGYQSSVLKLAKLGMDNSYIKVDTIFQ